MFKSMSGTYIVHIPFRGAGPAIAALLGGEIDMMIDNIPPQVPLIKSGRVRAIAVTSLKRVNVLPDVPTMDEIGLKGYEVVSFFGLAARAGTPREAVVKLNAALNKSSRDPKLREVLESRGATIVEGTPEDFLDFMKKETAKYAPVIKRAGVTVE
jgi:tripartite-type tricarboxylate transporter receptor subunit TctC